MAQTDAQTDNQPNAPTYTLPVRDFVDEVIHVKQRRVW